MITLPTNLAEGLRVGNYVLTRRIAAGAYGEVWQAQHHAWADKVVAVKIPTDPRFVRNLQRDGAAMHGLRHPGIVSAVDFDPYADVPYLAMEYVPGSSLRPLIDGRKLNVSQAVAILRQVLTALSYAHAQGIVHRDIKPENILIHESALRDGFSVEGLVKVTDFGLGHVQLSQESMELSGSVADADARAIVGTLAYMAPELLSGESADARADLYACGVVLFEMLAGRKPHGADLPSRTNKSVPRHLDDAFSRAYAWLDGRFTSAEEFRAALKQPDTTNRILPVAQNELVPFSSPRSNPAPLVSLGAISMASSLGIQFRRIEAGEFVMGSPAAETGHFDNEAAHPVKLTRPFLLSIHPVTRGQFAAFVADTGYKTDAEKQGWGHAWTGTTFQRIHDACWKNPGFEQTDSHPAVEISWLDAVAFCDWLSAKDSKTYHLPTEAQWEFACRAGTKTAYFWGDDPEAGNAHANFQGLPNKDQCPFTSPVGTYDANPWGLYDMSGNVWEWCSDVSSDYPKINVTDPTGPAPRNETFHVSHILRGGSWYSDPFYCRAAHRLWSTPEPRDYNFGFRVCLSP